MVAPGLDGNEASNPGKEAGSDLYLVKPVLSSKILNMVGMFLSAETPLFKKVKPAPAG